MQLRKNNLLAIFRSSCRQSSSSPNMFSGGINQIVQLRQSSRQVYSILPWSFSPCTAILLWEQLTCSCIFCNFDVLIFSFWFLFNLVFLLLFLILFIVESLSYCYNFTGDLFIIVDFLTSKFLRCWWTIFTRSKFPLVQFLLTTFRFVWFVQSSGMWILY